MIDVFYIAYLNQGSGWGIDAFNKFLSSYEKFAAGIEHRLIILLRGYEENIEDYENIKKICENKQIKTLDTKDTGMDFGAYLDGAAKSTAEFVFCMNSTCEIMCENWLKKIYSPIEKNTLYRMIGVNGSYELCPKYTRDFRLSKNIKSHIKIILESLNFIRILYRFLFTEKMKGFPNYYIRTAAFLIDRELFLKYFEEFLLPKTKLEAYKIENGEHSITKFLLNKNYQICVVDKYGNIFEKENFDKSSTFRSKEKNYIIKDRQIENYEKSNILFQRYLRKICWGK